jgi:hypothetical protein
LLSKARRQRPLRICSTLSGRVGSQFAARHRPVAARQRGQGDESDAGNQGPRCRRRSRLLQQRTNPGMRRSKGGRALWQAESIGLRLRGFSNRPAQFQSHQYAKARLRHCPSDRQDLTGAIYEFDLRIVSPQCASVSTADRWNFRADGLDDRNKSAQGSW